MICMHIVYIHVYVCIYIYIYNQNGYGRCIVIDTQQLSGINHRYTHIRQPCVNTVTNRLIKHQTYPSRQTRLH